MCMGVVSPSKLRKATSSALSGVPAIVDLSYAGGDEKVEDPLR
jgi:hypothetical protein